MTASSMFDLRRIAGETFVRDVEYHPALGSTNDRALELALQPDLATPHLVLAEQQTSGRGRGANVWWSARGALTFSLVLDADSHGLPRASWPQTSLAAGLAVLQALQEFAPGNGWRLKWPNDVFLDGRKASGLLVEVPATASGRLVVGVGVNVNNSLQSAPASLAELATSLIDATGGAHDLTGVLVRVLAHLEQCVALLAHRKSELLDRWRMHCALSGRLVTLRRGGDEAHGLCRGIDDDGGLLLETPAGIRSFQSGVVARFE